MINVSQTYLDEIYNDNTVTRCSVVYGAYDVTAKDLAAATSNGQQTFSPPSQTLNALNNFQRYTDLELNNWVLDGSVTIFPDSTAGTEWGWWSLGLSNVNGTFSTNPTLTYTWSENHSSVGIILTTNYALKQFKVYWYDANNTQLATQTVTNTDLTKTTYEVEELVANYQKIVVEFVQTLPYHYIKVQDILFGREYIWQDEIIEINVVESLDPTMQRLESKECTIRLGNIDGEYDKYNPNNRLRFFQEGQIMQVYNTAYLSTGTEQVPLGVFYLTGWGSPTQYTVEFKGNDLLYKLNDMAYFTTMRTSNTFAGTILSELLAPYNGEIQFTGVRTGTPATLQGYIPIMSYREAIQRLAFAIRQTCYVNRYGVLQFNSLDDTTSRATIDFTKKAPSQDEQGEMYNSATVSLYSYNEGASQELFKGAVSGTAVLTFSQPVKASSVAISGTYTSFTAYANCVKVVGASGTLTITGIPYETSVQPVTAYLTQDNNVGITKKNMPVDSVYLIGRPETATDVTTWLLGWLQKNITNEFRWLGNPAIEVGDYVTLQVAENQTKTALVVKNRFKYNGALSEESEVVIV